MKARTHGRVLLAVLALGGGCASRMPQASSSEPVIATLGDKFFFTNIECTGAQQPDAKRVCYVRAEPTTAIAGDPETVLAKWGTMGCTSFDNFTISRPLPARQTFTLIAGGAPTVFHSDTQAVLTTEHGFQGNMAVSDTRVHLVWLVPDPGPDVPYHRRMVVAGAHPEAQFFASRDEFFRDDANVATDPRDVGVLPSDKAWVMASPDRAMTTRWWTIVDNARNQLVRVDVRGTVDGRCNSMRLSREQTWGPIEACGLQGYNTIIRLDTNYYWAWLPPE